MNAKILATSLLLAFSVLLSGAAVEYGNWPEITQKYSENGKTLNVFAGKTRIATFTATKGFDIKTLKVAVKDGSLEIDTRDYYAGEKSGRLIYQLQGVPQKLIQPGKTAKVTIQMSTIPAGEGFSMQVSGQMLDEQGKQKHFWTNPTAFLGDETLRTRTLTKVLPETLKSLNVFGYLTHPAVYRIGKYTIDFVDPSPETEAIPAGNQLQNGGFERGFYMMPRISIESMGSSIDGTYHDNWGVPLKETCKLSFDTEVKRSGNYSLKIEQAQHSLMNRINFGSARTYVGKPITFSIWLKAEKPATGAMWLHIAPSCRYHKDFNVGREWKKITMTIPKFGEKAESVIRIGDPASGNPTFKTLSPTFYFTTPGTYWADDAKLEYALDTDDSGVVPPVAFSAEMNRPFIHENEAFEPTLTIENIDENWKSAQIQGKIVNVFGKTIQELKPEKVAIPFKRNMAIPAPAKSKGPMTICYTLTLPNGKMETLNLLSGVIGEPKPFHPFFATNVATSGRANHEVLADILKEFRIGSVRIWRDGTFDFPELDTAKLYHQRGFYILYCFSYAYARKYLFFLPKDPTEYLNKLENYILKNTKGYVDAYELFNEPNISGGKNPQPDQMVGRSVETVVDISKKMATVIRRADPKAKIAGPATCHTMVPWIRSYMDLGGKEFIDIITEHPYRQQPELPSYADDLAAIHAMSRDYGKDYPIFASENGASIDMAPLNNKIQVPHVNFASKLLRTALVGKASGLDKYFDFSTGGVQPSNSFSNLLLSDLARQYGGWAPSPQLYAFRAAADILEDAKFVKAVPVGMESRCYIFDRGDKRIVILWKWTGTPAPIIFKESVDYADFVGSEYSGKSFELNGSPVYIVTPKSAADAEKLVRSATILSTTEPCDVKTTVTGETMCRIQIRNLVSEKLAGKVVVTHPVRMEKNFENLEAEKSVAFDCALPERVSMTPQLVEGTIEVKGKAPMKFRQEVKGILVPRRTWQIGMNGNEADWAKAASVTLSAKNAGSQRGKLLPDTWTPEDRKITADLKLCWDTENLYVAMIVNKPSFHPFAAADEGGTWAGDGIQLAFDTLLNAVPGGVGYQDDDFEYDVALFNGKPLVFCHYASAATYDSLVKNIGRVNNVQCAITQKMGKTIYEVCFPTFTVSPFKLLPNSSCGFSILTNLNDGKKRFGYLELTPGIGDKKEPSKFTNIILMK